MGKPHHKLEIWKRSLMLVTEIYKMTARFPNEEKFGLVSKMRRAAVSIPSNIAEGAAQIAARNLLTIFILLKAAQLNLKPRFE